MNVPTLTMHANIFLPRYQDSWGYSHPHQMHSCSMSNEPFIKLFIVGVSVCKASPYSMILAGGVGPKTMMNRSRCGRHYPKSHKFAVNYNTVRVRRGVWVMVSVLKLILVALHFAIAMVNVIDTNISHFSHCLRNIIWQIVTYYVKNCLKSFTYCLLSVLYSHVQSNGFPVCYLNFCVLLNVNVC